MLCKLHDTGEIAGETLPWCAGHCLLCKLIWGTYLPQNLRLNSWEITVDEP